MTSFSKKQMKGLTLIEALLFLGIAAVVIVGAVAFYNNASNQTKLNEVKTQIQAIGGGVQSLYASQRSYTSVSTALVVNAGIAPQNAISGSTIRNPWGGDITVTGASRYFEVGLTNVPQDSCIAMISSGMISEGSIIRISVNGNRNFTTAPTPAQAITACSSAAANTIDFRFR